MTKTKCKKLTREHQNINIPYTGIVKLSNDYSFSGKKAGTDKPTEIGGF